MAANMLDSLFFSLGWDTRDFDRGRKTIERDFDRTAESGKKTANEIEAAGKRAASFFRTMRNETVGFFLALQGASSLKGFVSDLIDTAANTDRVAKNMGVARNELFAWQNLIKTVGGDAGEATSALQAMATQIQSWRLGVKTGNEGNLAGLGVTTSDFEKGPEGVLLKIADASKKMDRPQFAARLGMLGFSPATIELLSRGRGELEKQIKTQKEAASITDRDVEAAQKFQRTWAELATTIKGVVLPALVPFLEALDSIIGGQKGITSASPAVVVALGAMGAAALAAIGPWGRLAAAIIAVKMAGDSYLKKHPGAVDWLDAMEAPLKSVLPGWMFERPEGVVGTSGAAGGGAGGGAPPGAGGNVSSLFNVLKGKYGNDRARGIWAGIGAESSWNPNNVNPSSGAYGLGQWLGPRKKELFRRYGRNPTAAQQLQFLMWELDGGDPGGKSVLGQSSASGALGAYVNNFMRPGAGASGDMQRGMSYLGARAPAPAAGGGGSNVSIGSITVVTSATDANGIARDLPGALKRRGLVVQSATGMSQ